MTTVGMKGLNLTHLRSTNLFFLCECLHTRGWVCSLDCHAYSCAHVMFCCVGSQCCYDDGRRYLLIRDMCAWGTVFWDHSHVDEIISCFSASK